MKLLKTCTIMVAMILLATLVFAAGTQEVAPDEEGVTTFVVRNIAPGQTWLLSATPVGEAFVQKTGVDIQWEPTIGDENQAVALLLASGDLPDAIGYRGALGAAPFIDAGAALELTDLINEHAPNYKEALGTNWDRMRFSLDDPGRYTLARPSQFNREQFSHHGWFFLQHDVVMSQGYPRMETLEDYENAIKQYMEANPTINGQRTIGLSMVADGWRWIISLTNPGMMASGIQSSGEIYVDPDTLEVTYRVLRDEERAYYEWLNRMWNEGVLDREAFTHTIDQYQAKIATGRVLATTDMSWQIAQSEASLLDQGLPERTYGYYPIAVAEGVQNSAMAGDQAWDAATGTMVITTENRNPEKFMQFIDYLMSDEGQVLNNWGLEGVHYDVIDGRRVFRPEEREAMEEDPEYGTRTGIGLLSAPFPTYADGLKDASGQYYTLSSPQDVIAGYNSADREVLEAYGVTRFAELFAQPEDFPIRPWPKEGSVVNRLSQDDRVIFQRLQDTIKRDVIAAIVGPEDQFDANWEKFENNMRQAGLEQFEEAVEELIAETLELWEMED